MKYASVLALFSLVAAPAFADHNSPHGAGWANMPNDIHNTRIESDLSGREFADFVRQGAGAATINRYLDDSATVNRSGASRAAAAGGGRR